MALTIDITELAEGVLRRAFGDGLNRLALEAMAIEGYRTGKLSRFEVQTLLGFGDRWETEDWLASKGVHWNYDVDDLEADRRTLDQALGTVKS